MDTSTRHNNGRKRSRSPSHRDHDGVDKRGLKRHRSRSPHHHKHRHHAKPPEAKLPFRCQPLHKHDLDAYQALFYEYLELQKQLDVGKLTQDELKGRWKSFLGKWNRGELAEGWYDPETKKRADERLAEERDHRPSSKVSERRVEEQQGPHGPPEDDEEEDDGYGPTLPSTGGLKLGPTVPSFQDLQYKRELDEENRDDRIADLRYERQQDRKTQKDHLEELVPRAAPGSRERQLEKKRDVAVSNKTFAEAKEAGTEEVGESELLGDDGIDAFKAKKKEKERQKNEREVRKEEILRAREAERNEKLAKHREKEEKTMGYLRSLAQQRYGGGS
ncbi:hypothetical protein LTR37_019002 [Vermiconidia calcicola]|uniref:Uncharacterized protein n=1 Tax=Vermiconidia calcicola TaxID=1690605 RepID=A0ACC3MFF3_9PEZI|nr:hypothetical protein LTR37_019002 [Vermiconidia calcicola]